MEVELGRELVYEVAHPLVQDAIYRTSAAPAGGRCTATWPASWSRAGRYGAAASHVVQAADPGDEEAIETLCEALRRAEAGEHHQEALALLDALLELLPAGDRRWLKVLEVHAAHPGLGRRPPRRRQRRSRGAGHAPGRAGPRALR